MLSAFERIIVGTREAAMFAPLVMVAVRALGE